MARSSQFCSLGRFLYTQNPFYLISCFLILYGLQIATLAQGDLYTRSMFLTVSIAGYMLLMAVTCIAVVRWGKVWQDARSIFLVVIISQVALSSGLDEHCIYHWRSATTLLLAGAAFTLLVTEFLLHACRLRFPLWYRLSFYGLMSIFFLAPIGLGWAVIHREDAIANWGAPLFSTSIAAALLLLVPAVRRGGEIFGNSIAPWRWPYYPLAAFAILIVLAAIRAHAIWMSFGFFGASAQFEPFLLLPIGWAVLVLMVEADAKSGPSQRTYTAMALAPAMLLCGFSRDGMTHLPIASDMQALYGSAHTLTLAALAAFYLLVWIRGVKGSEYAVILSLFAMAGFTQLPTLAEAVGFRHWMYLLAASLFALAVCLRNVRSAPNWLVFTTVTVITTLTAGFEYDEPVVSMIVAAGFVLLALMTIGAMLDSELAEVLRVIAAAIMLAGTLMLVLWHVARDPGSAATLAMTAMSLAAIFYAQVVRRVGWLIVFAFEACCLCGVLGWDGYTQGTLAQSNWPIQSGMACFAIGVTITSVKTGVHRRWLRQLPARSRLCLYRPGL